MDLPQTEANLDELMDESYEDGSVEGYEQGFNRCVEIFRQVATECGLTETVISEVEYALSYGPKQQYPTWTDQTVKAEMRRASL